MRTAFRKTLSALLAIAMAFALFAAMPITAIAAVPPEAPSGLTSTQTPEGPKLTWTDNSDNEDGFFVERKEDGSDSWTELHPGEFHLAGSGTVGANVTTYTDDSAVEGQLYTYRVRAYNGIPASRLYSAWSNERTHRFWPQPSELTAVPSAGGMALNWKSNTTTQIGFKINRKEGSGSWELLTDSAPANSTTYLDTTAEVGKTYTYTVQAKREETITSLVSNEASATMIMVPMVAPSNLTATAGAGGITLNWQDNSDNEETFSIYRKEGSGSFALLLSVPANTTAYTDTTAEADKTYTYYVRSVKVGVTGADSNEATATMILMIPMVAPSNLTATAGAGGITLNWQDNSDNEETFSIYRKEGSGSFTLLLSVAANTTAYTDATAEAGKTYTYYVRSVKVGVTGANSNEATATMTAAPTTFTVTFNSNGGSAVATQTVATGGKATKPADPTRTGYTFGGWYADSGLNTVFDFNAVIAANITLYAKWNVAPATATGSTANFLQKNTYTPGMFTDVNENQWYGYYGQKVIANAYEYGLMSGYPDNTFKPMGNITLAEAITVAARVRSIYLTGTENFVQGSVWYQVYVDYAIANGIIAAGDFSNYARAATRAEMAYIFSRSLPASEFAAQNTVNSLPDVNSGTPYRDSILTLYRAGVLTGNNAQGSFSPNNNINRAEAAAIISRIILPTTRASGNVFG